MNFFMLKLLKKIEKENVRILKRSINFEKCYVFDFCKKHSDIKKQWYKLPSLIRKNTQF